MSGYDAAKPTRGSRSVARVINDSYDRRLIGRAIQRALSSELGREFTG